MTAHCPEAINAQSRPACHATIAGIAACPSCGAPMCPVCGRHAVQQLSRVTGYISTVSGWNEAKKQELKERRRSDIR